MTKSHLKRINAPKQWTVLRKERKFITRPNPGPHTLTMATSISTALKYFLGMANNSREVKYLLNTQEVLVDWSRRKDSKAQIGFFDTLSIPKQNIHYRMLIDMRGKLYFKKIDEKDSVLKISQIINKTQTKKGIQINLLDGRNIIVENNQVNNKKYTVGDSLLLELPSQKIKSIFKLEKGKPIMLYKGKYAGTVGVVEAIEGTNILFKSRLGSFHTKKDFAIVLGDDKPVIMIDSE